MDVKNRPSAGRFFTSMKTTTHSGVSCVPSAAEITYTTPVDAISVCGFPVAVLPLTTASLVRPPSDPVGYP